MLQEIAEDRRLRGRAARAAPRGSIGAAGGHEQDPARDQRLPRRRAAGAGYDRERRARPLRRELGGRIHVRWQPHSSVGAGEHEPQGRRRHSKRSFRGHPVAIPRPPRSADRTRRRSTGRPARRGIRDHRTALVSGFRSIVSVPLLHNGQPIGAIGVGRREPGRSPTGRSRAGDLRRPGGHRHRERAAVRS